MKIFLLAVFSFIQLSQCWPDFYYFSRNHTNGSLLVNGSLTGYIIHYITIFITGLFINN